MINFKNKEVVAVDLIDFMFGPRNKDLQGQSRQRFVGTRQTIRGLQEGGEMILGRPAFIADYNALILQIYLVLFITQCTILPNATIFSTIMWKNILFILLRQSGIQNTFIKLSKNGKQLTYTISQTTCHELKFRIILTQKH